MTYTGLPRNVGSFYGTRATTWIRTGKLANVQRTFTQFSYSIVFRYLDGDDYYDCIYQVNLNVLVDLGLELQENWFRSFYTFSSIACMLFPGFMVEHSGLIL